MARNPDDKQHEQYRDCKEMLRKIFAWFGNPEIIVTNNGTQFTSDELGSSVKSSDLSI